MVNHPSRLTGVILAAGRGSRLRPLSHYIPKPLLPICNKPIIQYQLEDMKRVGVEEAYIVVGHLKEEMGQHLEPIGEQLGITLHYVEQAEPLGIAHAVLQLESRLDSPFLLFLGDIMMHAPQLDEMVKLFWDRAAGGVLAVKREPDPQMIRRNFAVVLHTSGLVERVIEKPRFVNTDLKGCGIYLFDLPIFDAIRRTPRTALRDEYEITTSIQLLIDDGYPVYPSDIVTWDVNLTFACDLLDVNARLLDEWGHESSISPDAVLHEGASVGKGTVIGPGARVLHPIHLENCVIFADATVYSEQDLFRCLVTPHDTVLCHHG